MAVDAGINGPGCRGKIVSNDAGARFPGMMQG